MYLHKNGIRLRKVDYPDLIPLLKLKSESWFGTHKVSIINFKDQEIWFEKVTSDPTALILIAEEKNKPVGTYKITNIDLMNRTCDMSYDIFEAERGKRLSYRVVQAGVDFSFEILNVYRINTEVLDNNEASKIAVHDGGFVVEGLKRQAVYKCSQRIDSIVFGILRSDWEQLDRVKKYSGCCNLSYKPKDGK